MLRATILFGTLIAVVMALVTLLLPVELYDGYAILENGEKYEEKLSLSYFMNKPALLEKYADRGLVDIALKPIGWILVFIINIGLPYLIGYRISIARKQETNE